MKYRIKHVTEYIYADRVSHCYNLGHLIPRTSRRQTCLSARIHVSPNTSYSAKREDYFGNTAYHFEIQRPHKKLVITATSEVMTEVQASGTSLDLGASFAEAKQLLATSREPEVLAGLPRVPPRGNGPATKADKRQIPATRDDTRDGHQGRTQGTAIE